MEARTMSTLDGRAGNGGDGSCTINPDELCLRRHVRSDPGDQRRVVGRAEAGGVGHDARSFREIERPFSEWYGPHAGICVVASEQHVPRRRIGTPAHVGRCEYNPTGTVEHFALVGFALHSLTIGWAAVRVDDEPI